MRVLCLNLPHAGGRLQRRYVASYYAPNFLVPPIELMGLASIVNARGDGEGLVLDAIAGELGTEATLAEVRRLAPDLVVSLLGFGSFASDVEQLTQLRAALGPDVRLAAFGYLSSQRPAEVLRNVPLDALLVDEPEAPLTGYLDVLLRGADPRGVPGLWTRDAEGEPVGGPPARRLASLDHLPFADHRLIDTARYSEPLLGRSVAALLSARGCPHACSFCVRMYGRRFVSRGALHILAELTELAGQGLRRVRFMDDTFTLIPERLRAICDGIVDRGLRLRWTCLTRLDCLDDAGLKAMRRAGCRRVYCGIESGSQRLLDRFGKGLDVGGLRDTVRRVRGHGIEVSAFFIVGAPGETDDDVDRSIALAIESGLDYVIVTRMQYWPGTALYDELAGGLDFSLFPFRMAAQADAGQDLFARERRFYRRFYLRPGYVMRRLPRLLDAPGDLLRGLAALVGYVGARHPERDLI